MIVFKSVVNSGHASKFPMFAVYAHLMYGVSPNHFYRMMWTYEYGRCSISGDGWCCFHSVSDKESHYDCL